MNKGIKKALDKGNPKIEVKQIGNGETYIYYTTNGRDTSLKCLAILHDILSDYYR